MSLALFMPLTIQFCLLALVLAAGWFDLRVRRIPNWLTVSGVVLGIGMNAMLQQHGVFIALAGMACALLVYVPLYAMRGMGAGDVKLMAAVGALAGPSAWIAIFLATALLGGVVALVVVAAKKRAQETFLRLGTVLNALAHRRRPSDDDSSLDVRNHASLKLPHGAIIASGAMLILLLTRAGEWNW